jgi:peptidoglycan/xylan/chitin deacetylase (PgdA/CDA1 family)
MVSGPWTTRRASRGWPGLAAAMVLGLAGAGLGATEAARCERPLYLTFDTGHMGVADLVADVLRQEKVHATFFAAHEATQVGDGSLGAHWAPWWKARAQEGHEFASHTHDHMYWVADLPGEPPRFRVKASAGDQAGLSRVTDAAGYCEQILRAARILQAHTGVPVLPLFRAPGGRTSPRLLQAAQQCGYRHVGWSAAGFLGDELPSERFSNAALLAQALERLRSGDILVAHLGIWSRKDPWAPAVLQPLIRGLKARGFCFETLSRHPALRAWVTRPKG